MVPVVGWARGEKGWVNSFGPLLGVGRPIFSCGWVSCCITGIGTHLTQKTTGVTAENVRMAGVQ